MSKSVTAKREARFRQWVQQVKDFNARPEGMSMAKWCELNGVPISTFSTRLRKVQDRCLEEMESAASVPATSQQTILPASAPTFVEIPSSFPMEESRMVSIACGGFKLDVSEGASESFLIKLIGAMNHA